MGEDVPVDLFSVDERGRWRFQVANLIPSPEEGLNMQ